MINEKYSQENALTFKIFVLFPFNSGEIDYWGIITVCMRNTRPENYSSINIFYIHFVRLSNVLLVFFVYCFCLLDFGLVRL